MTDWNEIWAGMDEGGAPDPLLQEFVDPPGRSLDIGCGMGDNVIAMAVAGWEAHGCDSSTTAIERCRARSSDAVFHVADVTEGIPGGPYDLITMFYVHLDKDDHARLLGSIDEQLADGGRFLYVGHDEAFVASHHGEMGELEPSDDGHEHSDHEHQHEHGGDHHDWAEEWAEREVGGPDRIAAMLTGLTIDRAETIERRVFHGPQEIDVTDVVVVGTHTA